MIKYDRLWRTMKEKGITQLNRLRHNQNVEVNTVDPLCNILFCRVEDIMEHFPDSNLF